MAGRPWIFTNHKMIVMNKSNIAFDKKSWVLTGISLCLCFIFLVVKAQIFSSADEPHKKVMKKKKIGKMLGADISFLPQLESRGIKFSENGVEKDAMQILKDHKINYIRLRIF